MTDAGPGWTDDRFEMMKKLWLEGKTAPQIAKHLGGVTPSAVGGKIRRSHLTARSLPDRPQRRKQRSSTFARTQSECCPMQMDTSQIPTLSADPYISSFVELTGLETGATLEAHMCKWPIGEPFTESFSFCGRKRVSDKTPYCIEHNRVAYQPQAGKKKKADSSTNALFRSVEHYL